MSVDRVLVVGSGASGVHFAQTLLARGREVTMLDVGRRRAPAALPARLTALNPDVTVRLIERETPPGELASPAPSRPIDTADALVRAGARACAIVHDIVKGA